MRDLVLNRNFDDTKQEEHNKIYKRQKIGRFELKQCWNNIDKLTIKNFVWKFWDLTLWFLIINLII